MPFDRTTPLTLAILNNDTATVKMLLSLGAGLTFVNLGLGEDFTLSFNVDVRF